ncbi:chloride intracellular channel exl-1-like [Penaeus indicus]|uniref:chloride intracellular channel exl-1-like n=1 Tax=Penaeus indicus TaxID=29960 RepID=UPI00300D94AD
MGSVGQQQQATAGAAGGGGGVNGELSVYVKAGVDGERMGACPFCQRVLMVLLIKSQHNLLRFKVITTNPAKPPAEFKALGLKHVPALIHGDDGFDALDDIVHYLDTKFPGGGLEYNSAEADLATKDFFSKFCFYIKAVNQDPSKLDQALQRLNNFLERTHVANGISNGDANLQADEDEGSSGAQIQYLGGSNLTHLDCEVLPKLQHLRVAAKALKDYDIPTNLRGFWRYLHAAYTNPVFIRTCPCDQEIILHWHDRPETPKLSHKKHSVIAKEKEKYSFDVPVHACVVTVVNE